MTPSERFIDRRISILDVTIMPPPPWMRPKPMDGAGEEDSESAYHTNPAPSTLERPKEVINKQSTPAFALLCTMMDRLRSEDTQKRRDTLTRFIALWRIKVGNDLYPLIRLLLPDVRCNNPAQSSETERDQCII
jgi:hypothetical protein